MADFEETNKACPAASDPSGKAGFGPLFFKAFFKTGRDL
jgi:hypothetical protein